ncbi:MAG: SH3 domain-containing protein [Oscillatoria sp. Prado101]|jgi:hypothetical protein|nr:SH3 domain-containing protein [Oscillatoria sp. Prado101]
MKLENLLKLTMLGTLLGSFMLPASLPVKADPVDPNGLNNIPETGWSSWQRWDKMNASDLRFGLSKNDTTALMSLENLCFGEIETPSTEKKKAENYWYRINSQLINTSTGEIQIGCWENGRFRNIVTITARRMSRTSEVPPTPKTTATPQTQQVSQTDTTSRTSEVQTSEVARADERCRRVQAPVKEGLAIRSQPTANSAWIGGVANGDTVTITTNPATIVTVDGRNWVAIQSPVSGWVTNGKVGDKGNLILCKP